MERISVITTKKGNTMYTNIKNLPEGEYVTETVYTDRRPYKVVKKTAKTMVVAEVRVKNDPEWLAKKEFLPGGFCGHTPNQGEQTWIYEGVNEHSTKRIGKTKKGWSPEQAVYHHDYNF